MIRAALQPTVSAQRFTVATATLALPRTTTLATPPLRGLASSLTGWATAAPAVPCKWQHKCGTPWNTPHTWGSSGDLVQRRSCSDSTISKKKTTTKKGKGKTPSGEGSELEANGYSAACAGPVGGTDDDGQSAGAVDPEEGDDARDPRELVEDFMSREAVEAHLGEGRLPLFPLDLVQFPGETTPLHVFEPRYKIMFESITETKPPTSPDELTCGLLGIIREKTKEEVADDVGETDWKSDMVGTVLQVRYSNKTEDGEIFFCQALHRIEVSDVERNLFGYWSGKAAVTDPAPSAEGVEGLELAVVEAKDAYREFLKIEALGMEPWEQGALSQILELQSAEWPRLTHWLAARLPTPSVEKQPILESDDPIFRLLKIKLAYVRLAVHFARSKSSA
eukprot:m.153509 g.153509  ORF g.153509 m.153509 type:complete len:393 (+) comp23453_c0_seq3:115-1293(+)